MSRILISQDLAQDVTDAMSDTADQITEEMDKVTDFPDKVMEWALSQLPAVVHGVLMIILALVIFFVGRKIIRWIARLIEKSIRKSSMEESVSKFLMSCVRVILNVLLVVFIAGFLGLETTSLAAIVGSAGLAIGLSLQGSLSNFAGGVLILLIKPFVIGDYISSGGVEGTVVHIDIFYTRLLTVDNRMVVIPNGTLSNATITNVSNEPVRRVDVTVGIEYGEDIDRVKKILSDIVADNNDILKDREADIYVDALDASSVNMGIRVWTDSADYWKVKWAMLENIKKEFDKNGIAIPFNQLDVNVRTQQ